MQATYSLKRTVTGSRPHASRYAVHQPRVRARGSATGACRRRTWHPVSGANRKLPAPSLTTRVLCAAGATEAGREEQETVELEIKVDGMVCGGCSSRVEEALKKVENVKAVEVSLGTKLASVEVQAVSLIDAMNMLPKMVDTIKDLGFDAEPHIGYETPAELS